MPAVARKRTVFDKKFLVRCRHWVVGGAPVRRSLVVARVAHADAAGCQAHELQVGMVHALHAGLL